MKNGIEIRSCDADEIRNKIMETLQNYRTAKLRSHD
jgi:hypothetical protein